MGLDRLARDLKQAVTENLVVQRASDADSSRGVHFDDYLGRGRVDHYPDHPDSLMNDLNEQFAHLTDVSEYPLELNWLGSAKCSLAHSGQMIMTVRAPRSLMMIDH